MSYRIISLDEQKQLPLPITKWLEEHKPVKGRHDFYWLEKQYLLLSLGYRPSPGYRLNILKSEQNGSRISLIVKEQQPEQGMVYPQIIVFPYILLEVDQPVDIHLISASETSQLFQLK